MGDHADEHPEPGHAPGSDGHQHAHGTPAHVHGPRFEAPVLDIGGDVGALILYTDASYAEREIEVSPEGDDGHRTHTAIHQRRAAGDEVHAGIFPELRAGRYRIWADRPDLVDRVTIVGGEVAEVDWRSSG